MGFNLNEYETVEERLAKFIADYPDFRISTELESMADNRFIVKAYIFRTYADSVAFSTGYAEEKVSDRGVNSTSALENCETSAIGRALANAGYAAKGKRPSREEMAKVNKSTEWTDFVGTKSPDDKSADREPAIFSAVQEQLKAALGAEVIEPVPSCKHGEMLLKEGTKNGKAYKGYVCKSNDPTNKSCAIWYRLSPQGTWYIPNKDSI